MTQRPSAGEQDLLVEALDWIVYFKVGVPTEADAVALQRWRQQSPDHEAAFRHAVKAYRSGQLALDHSGQKSTRPDLKRMRSRKMARRLFLTGTFAAAAAGSLAISPPFDLWPSVAELRADYRTGKGERRRIAVEPGVDVELNTLTSLALRNQHGQKEISLVSGEAEVDVRPVAASPVVMLAADGRSIAGDAKFNASCLDSVVDVTCLEGTMRVEQAQNSVELRNSQQVTYSSAGLGVVRAVDVSTVSSWKLDLLAVRNLPLVDVIEKVNRYRPGRIFLTRPSLGQSLVNGTFPVHRLNDFVAQVEKLLGIEAIVLPGGIVLLG